VYIKQLVATTLTYRINQITILHDILEAVL